MRVVFGVVGEREVIAASGTKKPTGSLQILGSPPNAYIMTDEAIASASSFLYSGVEH